MSLSSYLKEFKALPLPAGPATTLVPEAHASVQVSLLIPVRGGTREQLQATLQAATQYLSPRFNYEVIVIAQSAKEGDVFPKEAEDVAGSFPRVRVVHHRGARGKGAGLQTGFLKSKGQWIWFTDADLPYDLSFFDGAAKKLKQGYGLVTGNRRLPESRFNLPVGLLNIAYTRHRLGLGFNFFARMLLPLKTRDTQSGIKAMTRELAQASLGQLRCPGFFFDLEIFLAAQRLNLAATELPVRLTLNSEKSTVRVLRESGLAGYWLLAIAWRAFKERRLRADAAGSRLASLRGMLARYAEASWLTRFFLAIRYWMTPYQEMASELPPQGRALDLGCGHGLLLWTAGRRFPRLELWGLDHDAERIRLAQNALGPRAVLKEGGATELQDAVKTEFFDVITAIDVMHYFRPEAQKQILLESYRHLSQGGKLVVREVNPSGGLSSWINRAYELFSTSIGITRSKEKTNLFFRDQPQWTELLREVGFEVKARRCSHPLFADILYVCEKPEPPTHLV